MIDPKVFAELQNRGIVTVVGLNPSDFKNLDELKNYGLATSIATDEEYTNAIAAANYVDSFLKEMLNGGFVTLDGNITVDSPVVVEKDVTLDLNGYNITSGVWDEDGDPNSYVFWVKGGKLTITGKGTVQASDATYSMAVWANGGDVEINDGIYKNGGDSCDLIYASKAGNIVINGGVFDPAGPASGKEPGTKDPYTALNIKDANKDTCSISVRGGKFYNFDPANNFSENPQMDFCAPGYSTVADGTVYTVVEGVKTEAGLHGVVATGGNIKLLSDIVLSKYANVKTDVTVDLNGYSITHPATSTDTYKDVFEVMTGGKLTINGKGSVIAEDGYAVYAAGDSVVILNDGCYFSPVSAVDARKHANVTINGGEFKVDGSNNADGDFGQKFTLNLRDKKGNYVTDTSDIKVKGGRFYKYNPAASESEPEITNFVVDGYKSVQDGDWYVVVEA